MRRTEKARREDRKVKRIVRSIFITVPILLFGIWFAFNSYVPAIGHVSEGKRVGAIRKLSKKGWIWKTWEGELALNAGLGATNVETFKISVANDSVAQALYNQMGNVVEVTYDEYFYKPFRMGDSDHLVSGFVVKQTMKE